MDKKTKLYAECNFCQRSFILNVHEKDLRDWQEGRYIQDAMPYLTAGERELLISNTCESCFMKMFDF